MTNDWRYTATLVSKYNPLHRKAKGEFQGSDWVGFFQIGKKIGKVELTFESYAKVEKNYITAATLFFTFHNCQKFVLRNLEKNDFADYNYNDREDLIKFYDVVYEGMIVSFTKLEPLLKLILRDVIWAELHCEKSEETAIRFGHDFYMYLNSNQDISTIIPRIQELGLFID